MSINNLVVGYVVVIVYTITEDLFEMVLNNIKISAHERKNMVNGLSSILDSTDDSSLSQQLYITTEERLLIIQTYRNKHAVKSISFPD